MCEKGWIVLEICSFFQFCISSFFSIISLASVWVYWGGKHKACLWSKSLMVLSSHSATRVRLIHHHKQKSIIIISSRNHHQHQRKWSPVLPLHQWCFQISTKSPCPVWRQSALNFDKRSKREKWIFCLVASKLDILYLKSSCYHAWVRRLVVRVGF